MKLLRSNIIRPTMRLKYDANENGIVRVMRYELGKESEEALLSEEYYDFSHIEEGKLYHNEMPFIQLSHDDGELRLTVVRYTGESLSEDELTSEWQDIELKEFDIPEGADVIELEEVIAPEPEPDPLDKIKAENKALEIRVEQMKKQLEEDRKANESTTLELLELMMGLL